MSVIDPDGRYVYEMFGVIKDSETAFRARDFVKNDLQGQGVYPWPHGTRAYGGSAIGGLIRKGEFANGIKHALALATYQPVLNRNAPGGKSYVWPANSWDGSSGYGTTGNLYMGSMLAIPASVDINSLGLHTDQTKALARALQLYGGYIVDSAGAPEYPDGIVMYAEIGSSPEWWPTTPEAKALWDTDNRLIHAQLKIVTNNGPNSVGGGGTPLTSLAPAFGTKTGTAPATPSDLSVGALTDTTARSFPTIQGATSTIPLDESRRDPLAPYALGITAAILFPDRRNRSKARLRKSMSYRTE